MGKNNFTVSKVVHLQAVSFLEKMKHGDISNSKALRYLAFLANNDEDKNFISSDKQTADMLRNNAYSLGFISEGGIVSKAIQRDLRSFFADRNNGFIVKNGDSHEKKEIEEIFASVNDDNENARLSKNGRQNSRRQR